LAIRTSALRLCNRATRSARPIRLLSAPCLGPPASTLTVARAREQASTTPITSLPSWNATSRRLVAGETAGSSPQRPPPHRYCSGPRGIRCGSQPTGAARLTCLLVRDSGSLHLPRRGARPRPSRRRRRPTLGRLLLADCGAPFTDGPIDIRQCRAAARGCASGGLPRAHDAREVAMYVLARLASIHA